MAYPALRLESIITEHRTKPQRERFCHKNPHKKRLTTNIAKSLSDRLRDIRREYPGFASRIDQFIATVESDSKRSRGYDRERVTGLLRAWPCGLTVKELMEDTGFTHWDIRTILADLIKRNSVTVRIEVRAGRNTKVYSLT